MVPSSCLCQTKNVPSGTGCKKILNCSLHTEYGLNKNASLGLVACAVWGSREALEANLKSQVTSSASLKTFSNYFIFYMLECVFRGLINLDLIQVF